MTIQEILRFKHNKENKDKILQILQDDPTRIDELMKLFFSKDKMICQRASWPVGYLGEKLPELLYPYFERMIRNLDKPLHDAVIRNTLRTWKAMDIPEEFEGEVFEKCFEYTAGPQYAVAIRAFAMITATNIAMKYPELAHELIPTIEETEPYGTSGLKNCCKHQLNRLRKLPLD